MAPRRALTIFLAAMAFALAAAFSLKYWSTSANQNNSFAADTQDGRWGSGYMPNVPVVDQDGKTFNFYDDLIKNKKVIINFIYTSCSQICPLTTSRLAIVQDKLGDSLGRDFFMYSVSVDPEHDGPAQLKQYANAFSIKSGWKLLTGKPEDIAQIRYKLGERSRSLNDHKQELVLGDDVRRSWARNSVFGDLDEVVLAIRQMDPSYRPANATLAASEGKNSADLAPGEMLFGSMCAGCHAIGPGGHAGPDLNGVTERRDHEWLRKFISRPDLMFAKQDPVALDLARKFPVIRMPNLGLSESDADDVISFISAKSKEKDVAKVN